MKSTGCENCRQKLALLTDPKPSYLDSVSGQAVQSSLLGPAERKHLEQHVAACPECTLEWTRLRSILHTLQDLPAVAAPPQLRGAIRAQIARETVHSPKTPWWAPFGLESVRRVFKGRSRVAWSGSLALAAFGAVLLHSQTFDTRPSLLSTNPTAPQPDATSGNEAAATHAKRSATASVPSPGMKASSTSSVRVPAAAGATGRAIPRTVTPSAESSSASPVSGRPLMRPGANTSETQPAPAAAALSRAPLASVAPGANGPAPRGRTDRGLARPPRFATLAVVPDVAQAAFQAPPRDSATTGKLPSPMAPYSGKIFTAMGANAVVSAHQEQGPAGPAGLSVQAAPGTAMPGSDRGSANSMGLPSPEASVAQDATVPSPQFGTATGRSSSGAQDGNSAAPRPMRSMARSGFGVLQQPREARPGARDMRDPRTELKTRVVAEGHSTRIAEAAGGSSQSADRAATESQSHLGLRPLSSGRTGLINATITPPVSSAEARVRVSLPAGLRFAGKYTRDPATVWRGPIQAGQPFIARFRVDGLRAGQWPISIELLAADGTTIDSATVNVELDASRP